MQLSQERTPVRSFAQTFAATATAPREARRMIESWSDEVDPEILHTLRLLVSEVIGLSVRNEDVDIDAEDGPPVELSMDFDERRVRVEALCVTGRYSFPNALAEVADLSLALIDALSDRWGV